MSPSYPRASTLTKVLRTSSGQKSVSPASPKSASAPVGAPPKFPSKFPSETESVYLIRRASEGANVRSIVEQALAPADVEREASNVSPSGTPVDPSMVKPGSMLGIRGGRHSGHHAVVSVRNGIITLKNEEGYEESIPLEDLENHDVYHTIVTI